MKKFVLLIVVFTAIWGLSADNFVYYTGYSPVLMERSDLEKSVKGIAPLNAMENPGKIYIKGTRLFVVEKYSGIHVINNEDPSAPKMVKFITIPGVVDIAVKGDILYADNAVDLVGINISNMDKIRVQSRVKNVFPELIHPELRYIPSEFRQGNRPANTVIVNWKRRES